MLLVVTLNRISALAKGITELPLLPSKKNPQVRRHQQPDRPQSGRRRLAAKCHADGTVTYWSVYNQAWVRRAYSVPDRELAAMGPRERQRVIAHLRRHEGRHHDEF